MAHVRNKKADDKKATVVAKEDKNKNETEGVIKLQTYLKTIPIAKKKFARLPKRKKSPTSAELLLIDPRYSASKEGPLGLGPIVLPFLQRFNNIDGFMTLYVAAVLIHGALFAVADMTLNIYQVQFSLSRTEWYLMDFSDYIASFIVAIIIAHFGSKGNRTRWVAASCILMGLESMLFAFPFFTYEIIIPGRQSIELCIEENEKRNIICGNSVPNRSKCIYFHIAGQCIHGIAGIPIYILGMTFIFDHIPTSSCGFYLAIGHSAYLMGYLLGIVGGLQNFQPPPKEKIIEIEPAKVYQLLQSGWWKTFLIIAAISFCVSFMMACFPTSLPGAHKLRLAKRKEPPTIDRRLKDMKIQPHLKGFLHNIWHILKNPLMLTQAICKVSEYLTFNASLYFLPHHLQTQFLITPGIASLLTGAFVLPGAIIGHFLGGLIVDRLEMTNKNKLKFTLVTTVVSVGLFLLIFFVECQTTTFAGINEDYDGYGQLGNLTADCNEYCDCTTSLYSSICGRDEKEYFSPCFAGCRATKVSQTEKTYYNCSCIKEGLATSDDEGQFIDAIAGTCDTNCLKLPLFFAFYFSATVFSNMCSIPVISIILQSVPANFTSLSLGLTYAIVKFVACVPAPLLFRMSSAIACIYWDINRCGGKERCWIYDKKILVYEFMGIWMSSQLIIVLLDIYAIQIHDVVVHGEITESKTTVKDVKAQKERKA
ncbi:solute carrier organic anion transporter family member 6A1-like [Mus caroli]|uniref:Solute carrier organic anion transporter family member 6A1-like n=1 Tax=Mus caroli TaxID=10089 RepID=A0A6P5PYD2_MUSCR|nr:solute carrier organic anion transporter family member 6A1-like [Mus caroli]XP_021019104.1 solute carrier organic anion transporter family member 6A1-like [Mus caroli]